MHDEIAADDAQQLTDALEALEAALENTCQRFRASFESVGFSPRVVEFLETSACLRLADRKLAAIETADPTQGPRCAEMAAELVRRRAPHAAASHRMH